MSPQRVYLFLLCLYGSAPAVSQLNLFSGLSFEHEVTERWGYSLELDHRQQLNTGRENRVLGLVAVNRQFAERLSVTPGIRFTPRYGADRPGELRIFTDLNYWLPLGQSSFSVEGRLRLQHERTISGGIASAAYAARPRVGFVYSPNQFLDLVSEYEARFRPDLPHPLSRHRWTVGLEQQLTSGLSVEIFYRLEWRTRVDPLTSDPTLGLYLNYQLPQVRDQAWKYRHPFGRRLSW